MNQNKGQYYSLSEVNDEPVVEKSQKIKIKHQMATPNLLPEEDCPVNIEFNLINMKENHRIFAY